jgi:hypothetical protein
MVIMSVCIMDSTEMKRIFIHTLSEFQMNELSDCTLLQFSTIV